MSQAARSASIGVSRSDKMVCVDCFRTKGDGDMTLPCQNPKCHFYLGTSKDPLSSPTDDVFHDTFYKEVGHDRKTKTLCQEQIGSGMRSTNRMWGYQPFHVSMHQVTGPNPHSKSVTTSTGDSSNLRRFLSSYRRPIVEGIDGEKLGHHPRLMSLPNPAEYFFKFDGEGDLVEDAFLTCPFANYADNEKDQFVVGNTDKDVDTDICVPFGNVSAAVDWLDTPNKPPTVAVATRVPTVSSVTRVPTVSSAIQVPTFSSATGAHGAFDMTLLQLEMSKAQAEQSLVAKNKTSPDRNFPANNVTTLLGLGKLAPCSDTYSRKVFIGGLPPDVDENDIRVFFQQFGLVVVDWPHKSQSKGCIPPKGYAFLLFKNESAVHKLLLCCISEGEKHFIYMPSLNLTKKKVQIRPWYIADSYHSMDVSSPIDPRKAVFVGGVPRPLKASELAEVMTEKYGNISFILIDSDTDLRYPKGAACAVFSSHASYIAAVSARFMQLNYGTLDKKIEIKPYVLDGQMCDECSGVQSNGKPAPFYCGSVMCLQYYCEYCWATVHSLPGRQNHRPLLKDIGDKARFY